MERKITNRDFSLLKSIRRSPAKCILAVCRNKNGEFGKPWKYQVYGNETPEDVIERLTRLNNREYRLVEA